MRKSFINLKFLKVIFICFIIFQLVFAPSVNAEINSQYSDTSNTFESTEEDATSLLSIFADVVLPIVFPIVTAIESLVSFFMRILTGEYMFPWGDKIVFNTIPLLDVNFINPSEGSLFMGANQQFTVVGDIVRNVYFSILGICLVFLGVCVAITGIKLALSSIAHEKAKYKEAINATLITIVLIFSMHYVISFVFYINEQLVIVASNLTKQVISPEDTMKVGDILNENDYEENKKLVENFFDSCDHTSYSPITLVKSVAKSIGNFFADTWERIKGVFTTDDENEQVELSGEEVRKLYEDVFPSRDQVMDYLSDGSQCTNQDSTHRSFHVGKEGVNVAAYLLKNYDYRKLYLWSVAGNDSNKFSNEGIAGIATSFSNTVLWGTGIIDTGLLGLENLYESTNYICKDIHLNSAKEYQDIIKRLEDIINSNASEEEKNSASILKVYYDAYFKYIYDGEDKVGISINNIIQGLGLYFKRNAYYADVDNGDWSPNSFSVIPAILYCIFIVQSFGFLFKYIRRLIFIIILSFLGPVVVLYDYAKRMF